MEIFKSDKKNIIITVLILLIIVILVCMIFIVIDDKQDNNNQRYNDIEQAEIEDSFSNDIIEDEKQDDISTKPNENKNHTSNTTQSKNEETTKKQNPTTNSTTQPNTTKHDEIMATKEYSCIEPFELNGTKCVKVLETEPLVRYSCNEGELNGSLCQITTKVQITPNQFGSAAERCAYLKGTNRFNICLCTESGDTFENSGCYRTVNITKNATPSYSCTSGLELVGSKCVKYYESDAVYKYTCPSGYKLNGTTCVK